LPCYLMNHGVFSEVMPLIEKRIGQVRRGIVELNSSGDENEYKDKRGINPKYTLDSSPMVRMFLKETFIKVNMQTGEK
jgi:hypothetical protein